MNLYARQAAVKELLLGDLVSQGYAFLKAGARSGKTTIMHEMLHDLQGNYEVLVLNSALMEQAKLVPELRRLAYPRIESNVAPYMLVPRGQAPFRVLYVFDEAMWNPKSFAHFEHARELRFHCLVLSSRGPEYRALTWAKIPGRRYAAWDLNDNITRATLAADYARDPSSARYDYEGF